MKTIAMLCVMFQNKLCIAADNSEIATIVSAIQHSRSHCDSLRVELSYTSILHVTPVQLHDRIGKIHLRNGTERLVFDAKGRRRISSTSVVDGYVTQKDGKKHSEAVKVSEDKILDGESIFQLSGIDLAVFSTECFPPTATPLESQYFKKIGWFLSHPIGPVPERSERVLFSLPDCLSNRAFVFVPDPADQGHEGQVSLQCHLTSPDHAENAEETIVLDSSRAYCLLRREIRVSSKLIEVTEATHHQEIAEGLWLPTKLSIDEYDPTTVRNESLVTTTISAEFHDLNNVGDDAFKLAVFPGMVIQDFVEASERGVEGKAVMKTVGADGAWIERQIVPIANQGPFGFLRLFAITLGSCVLLLALLAYFRKRAPNS